jgi:hypothetical protein
MKTFATLNDKEKIDSIKTEFSDLLEELAMDPTKLDTHFKMEKPVKAEPVLAVIDENLSDDAKNELKKSNDAIIEKMNADFNKSEAEYAKFQDNFAKIKVSISNLKKMEGCVCGSCFDITTNNAVLPREFQMIIALAKKKAEAKQYK